MLKVKEDGVARQLMQIEPRRSPFAIELDQEMTHRCRRKVNASKGEEKSSRPTYPEAIVRLHQKLIRLKPSLY